MNQIVQSIINKSKIVSINNLVNTFQQAIPMVTLSIFKRVNSSLFHALIAMKDKEPFMGTIKKLKRAPREKNVH